MQVKPAIQSLLSVTLLLAFLLSLGGRSLHAFASHSDLSEFCEAKGSSSHLHETIEQHLDCDLFHIKITEYKSSDWVLPGVIPPVAADGSLFLPAEYIPSADFPTALLRGPPYA